MKTSHWGIIAALLIPVANQGLTSICGHAVDVTAINWLSIASEIFAVTLGSADWINRHLVNPQEAIPQPQTVIMVPPQSVPQNIPRQQALTTANGFQYAINWTGTDATSGLPTLNEGMDLKINVPTAQIITLEIRDSMGNLVLAGDVDASTITKKLQRSTLSLKGKAHIKIMAYNPSLGWGSMETDLMIV